MHKNSEFSLCVSELRESSLQRGPLGVGKPLLPLGFVGGWVSLSAAGEFF